jgi:flagellin-like hook-associated protein FlgL
MEVMMQINHNIRAMITQHSLYTNNNAMSKSLEKLSTGLRVNRAQDDAAGLAMSEQMRSQIRGLGKAKQNAGDGIAALQIAEGALAEITNMMQRQKELAVQAANDTLTSTERMYLNDEFQQLTVEMDRIAKTTDYNGKNVLIFDTNENLSFGATKLNPYNKEVAFMDASKVLYDAMGAKLTGGFAALGMTGKDGAAYATAAAGSTTGITIANVIISDINKVISEASLIGLSEGNIKEVLQKILECDQGLNGANSVSLGGASVFADASNVPGGDGLNLADVDRQTIKQVNQFLRDVRDAYDTILATETGDPQFGGGDIKKAAMYSMAAALDKLFQSDNTNIVATQGDGSTLESMQTIAGSNYSMLANASNRIIDLLKQVGLDDDFALNSFATDSDKATISEVNIAKLGSIFSRTGSPQLMEDLRTVLAFDVSKMSDGDYILSKVDYTTATPPAIDETTNVKDYEIAMALQKTLGELQKAYTDYTNERSFPVGTAASDVLHIGPNYSKSLGGKEASEIMVNYVEINTKNLGMESQSIDQQRNATRAIDRLDEVIKIVSGNRAAIGTYINRLEYTINNIASMTYNTQEAESRIRDTDFSKETTEFTKNQIMVQSATSILAQANSLPQAVLGLIG